MGYDLRRGRGVQAAQAAGVAAGYESRDPQVLQATNNIVMWLRPHPVVAKVGTSPHSASSLSREAAASAALAARGAPVGVPLSTELFVDEASGLPATLWERLPEVVDEPTAVEYAATLGEVHEALRDLALDLPDFTTVLDHARVTLFDVASMHLLDPSNLAFVRDAFDQADVQIRAHAFEARPIHGEPHRNNIVNTAKGPRLIDFESVCHGPVEWDLASVDTEISDRFPRHDRDLLRVARRLNSARVATWCWHLADIPEMRHHGEVHLQLLHGDGYGR